MGRAFLRNGCISCLPVPPAAHRNLVCLTSHRGARRYDPAGHDAVVVGSMHPNADGSNRLFEIALCVPGEPITLVREPKNKHDPSAVAGGEPARNTNRLSEC